MSVVPPQSCRRPHGPLLRPGKRRRRRQAEPAGAVTRKARRGPQAPPRGAPPQTHRYPRVNSGKVVHVTLAEFPVASLRALASGGQVPRRKQQAGSRGGRQGAVGLPRVARPGRQTAPHAAWVVLSGWVACVGAARSGESPPAATAGPGSGGRQGWERREGERERRAMPVKPP